jgi:hypothetical protein
MAGAFLHFLQSVRKSIKIYYLKRVKCHSSFLSEIDECFPEAQAAIIVQLSVNAFYVLCLIVYLFQSKKINQSHFNIVYHDEL